MLPSNCNLQDVVFINPLKKLALINSKFLIKKKRKKPAARGPQGGVMLVDYIVSTSATTLSKVPNVSNTRIESDEGFNNIPYYIENCQNLFVVTTLDA